MKRKKGRKLFSLLLTAALVLSLSGIVALAAESNKQAGNEISEEAAAQNLSFKSSKVSKTTEDAPFTNTLSGAVGKVTYTSSNKSVATVDKNGKVTVTGAGTATIKAADEEGTASYTLTVTKPAAKTAEAAPAAANDDSKGADNTGESETGKDDEAGKTDDSSDGTDDADAAVDTGEDVDADEDVDTGEDVDADEDVDTGEDIDTEEDGGENVDAEEDGGEDVDAEEDGGEDVEAEEDGEEDAEAGEDDEEDVEAGEDGGEDIDAGDDAEDMDAEDGEAETDDIDGEDAETEDGDEADSLIMDEPLLAEMTGMTVSYYSSSAADKEELSFAGDSTIYKNVGDDQFYNELVGADGEVEYSSSDESVASVSKNGIVTINSEGGTIITAKETENSQRSASYMVFVSGDSESDVDSTSTGDSGSSEDSASTGDSQTKNDTMNIRVILIWEGDTDSMRPDNVQITLLADGKESATMKLTASGDWRHTWVNLPVYSEDNEKIEYTVREDNTPSGYTPTYGDWLNEDNDTYSLYITNTWGVESGTPSVHGPKTSDVNFMVLYMYLAVLSGAAIITLGVCRRVPRR